MSVFIDIIEDLVIFLIAIALVALTASYAATAAAHITNIPDWASNPKLASAHKYLSWAASVGWIFIGLVIAVIVLLIILAITGIFDFGLSDIIEASILPTILSLINFLMVGVLLTIGILSAIGTYDIDQSGVSSPELTLARSKALIATLVSLGVLGLLLIYYVVSSIIKSRQKKKRAEQEAAGLEKLAELNNQVPV
jgi:hypothetical protein